MWNEGLRVLQQILDEWILLNTITTLKWSWHHWPKTKMEALERYDKPKEKKITQPNSHRDELEECHVQERLAAINKWSIQFSQFLQSSPISTSLFFMRLRRTTYDWFVSSPFRRIPLSMSKKPRVLVWSYYDRQFHRILIL